MRSKSNFEIIPMPIFSQLKLLIILLCASKGLGNANCASCQNADYCYDDNGSAMCMCDVEYTGQFCQKKLFGITWSQETDSTDCDTVCKNEGYSGAVFVNDENYAVCSIKRPEGDEFKGIMGGNNIPGSGECNKNNLADHRTPYRCLCNGFKGAWIPKKSPSDTCIQTCDQPVLIGAYKTVQHQNYLCRGWYNGKLVNGDTTESEIFCTLGASSQPSSYDCYCRTEREPRILKNTINDGKFYDSMNSTSVGPEKLSMCGLKCYQSPTCHSIQHNKSTNECILIETDD